MENCLARRIFLRLGARLARRRRQAAARQHQGKKHFAA
jgi:hypothetical protein